MLVWIGARTCALKRMNLGDKVRDRITGFTGILIAKTEWLNGCVRAVIQPQALEKGKVIEATTFDINQLELLEPNSFAQPKQITETPPARRRAGPMPDPVREGAA